MPRPVTLRESQTLVDRARALSADLSGAPESLAGAPESPDPELSGAPGHLSGAPGHRPAALGVPLAQIAESIGVSERSIRRALMHVAAVHPPRPAVRYRPVRWHPQLVRAFDEAHSPVYLPWQPGVLVPRHGRLGRLREQRACERDAWAERWESGV